MDNNITFHGAADTVTGSCHLLKAGGLRILVDCGLFQGTHELENRNFDDFEFDPASIDVLLLTHGHLDHCGRIPVLVAKGFRGQIICTAATYDVVRVVLLDAARIQEEDFERWQRMSNRKDLPPRRPLYTTLEALDALEYFTRHYAQYEKPVRLSDKVSVRFRDAGHILGAAFLELEVKGEYRIIFSGDLGNHGKPVVRDPQMPGKAEFAVVETTYADRNHRQIAESVKELRDVINGTFNRGGNVMIPSFAIERAQDLLFYIRDLIEKGEIPHCSVFLDTPMGISFTNIIRRHRECQNDELRALFDGGEDPFEFPGLQLTKTTEESQRINFVKSNAIIIAGSGMCTGGRIRHHLKHGIWRPENSLVFVGYQAYGTLGRQIVDGAEDVRIYGELYRVRAKVHTIGGFSSHAGHDDLLRWVSAIEGLDRLFLVHGEKAARSGFKDELVAQKTAREIIVPHLNEKFSLSD